MAALEELRGAELAFLNTGDKHYLDRAEALVGRALRGARFASATQLWLSLQRYDRGEGDRRLDAVVAACAVDGASADPWLAAAAAAALLRRWTRDGAAADLDLAVSLARDAGAGQVGPGGWRDLPLWLSPAWRAIDLGAAYLERSRLDTDSGADHLLAARDTARRAVRLAPTQALKALGLRYLACCDQELYVRRGTRRLLDLGIRRYQRALAMLPLHSVLRPMLVTELGTALQDRFSEDQDPDDIDAAVSHAERALSEATAAGASRPDLACHLVNLGTALNTRYEQTGDPHDLDGAVRYWTAAIGELPPASAYRPVFLDRLALGHAIRWEHGGGGEEDLDAAIRFGRRARDSDRRDGEPAVDSALGSVLHDRFGAVGWLDDLEEVIARYREALKRQAAAAPVYPAILSNLATALQDRFLHQDDSGALDEAIRLHEQAVDACPPRAPDRPGYLGTLAVAVRLRFDRDGRDADLER